MDILLSGKHNLPHFKSFCFCNAWMKKKSLLSGLTIKPEIIFLLCRYAAARYFAFYSCLKRTDVSAFE